MTKKSDPFQILPDPAHVRETKIIARMEAHEQAADHPSTGKWAPFSPPWQAVRFALGHALKLFPVPGAIFEAWRADVATSTPIEGGHVFDVQVWHVDVLLVQLLVTVGHAGDVREFRRGARSDTPADPPPPVKPSDE